MVKSSLLARTGGFAVVFYGDRVNQQLSADLLASVSLFFLRRGNYFSATKADWIQMLKIFRYFNTRDFSWYYNAVISSCDRC
ncbi:hypothetical protein [Nostoc sp. DedQUE12b]|uniref:hypothetical protein n=1 Tax=Nostoc sp. DedQUE12b TaxID=3075398 RepID=UPI003A0FBCD1